MRMPVKTFRFTDKLVEWQATESIGHSILNPGGYGQELLEDLLREAGYREVSERGISEKQAEDLGYYIADGFDMDTMFSYCRGMLAQHYYACPDDYFQTLEDLELTEEDIET